MPFAMLTKTSVIALTIYQPVVAVRNGWCDLHSSNFEEQEERAQKINSVLLLSK